MIPTLKRYKTLAGLICPSEGRWSQIQKAGRKPIYRHFPFWRNFLVNLKALCSTWLPFTFQYDREEATDECSLNRVTESLVRGAPLVTEQPFLSKVEFWPSSRWPEEMLFVLRNTYWRYTGHFWRPYRQYSTGVNSSEVAWPSLITQLPT